MYWLNPSTLISIVIAAISFGGAWTIQDWRFGAKEKALVEQKLAEVRLAAEADKKRLESALRAQAKAVERERKQRAAAAALRGSVVSLSTHTAATVRDASASQAACLERVDTLGKLFDASAEAYSDMAGAADRHVSDIKTLIDAYPKE